MNHNAGDRLHKYFADNIALKTVIAIAIAQTAGTRTLTRCKYVTGRCADKCLAQNQQVTFKGESVPCDCGTC